MNEEIDIKSLVRDGYNTIAKLYTSARDLNQPDALLLDELIEKLPPNAVVLDAGCGGGIPVSQKLSQHVKVIGVDFSESQLAIARQNIPNAEFQLADISQLDFPDATFDAIACYYAIFHLPREEHPSILANFHRLLKPNGYLLISLGTSGGVGIEEDWLGGGAAMYWSNYDTETNIQMVRDAEFDIIWHRLIAETLIEEGDDPEEAGHHLFIFAQKKQHSTENL